MPKKKYLLPTKRDREILEKCEMLEKNKLSKQDKFTVKLVKSQLEDDWRAPLLRVLNKLLSQA
ncbi:MAG: hypothetical protein WC862_04080 [Patescibacteria group bacterium]